MWRATLRSLLSHRLRLALSGLAIVLGVAFVSGTMIFTDTLARTFDNLFNAASADVTVQPKAAFDVGLAGTGASAGVPATMPASVIAHIAGIDGVAAVAGDVQAEGVYVLDKNNKVLSTGGSPGIGINWNSDRSVSPIALTQGRGPTRSGEIALDNGTIAKTGYRIGDTVPILTTGPRVDATLVGIFKYGASGGLAGASLTAFDTATAQKLFGQPGQFTGASVTPRNGVSNEELKARIAQDIGDHFDVKTRKEQSKALAASVAQTLQFLNVFLLVFAGIALFVGTFIILNTFAMLVAQRTKELALLRALGASRGQITCSVLTEAVILGVVGSTVGLLAGLGIAAGLRRLFATFGLTIDGSLVFAARTIAWSYVIGVLVTMLASYLPARRAARVPPVAAMLDDVGASERPLRRRTTVGLALALAGAGALLISRVVDDGNTAASWVGGGTVALIVGTIVLSPALARPCLRAAGGLLSAVWGPTGRLARDNVLRNPRRTAATASALMIGLALVTAFSILGASTNASIGTLIDQRLRADFVISTTIGKPFTPNVAARASAVAGVEAIMQVRVGTALVQGEQATVTAVDARVLDQTIKLDYVAGSTAGLADSGMLIDQTTAAARGWSLGDHIRSTLPTGKTLDLQVVGIYKPDRVIGSVVVALTAFEAAGGAALDQYVYIDLVHGADTATVRSALDQVVTAYPVVTVKNQAEFKAEQRGSINQLLLLLNALLALSVLIAALGIMNTLALAVIERTREIGLLRAVGTTRRQIRTMIVLEAIITSIYGALLGILVGVAFGVSLQHALAGQGISVLSIPVGRITVSIAIAAAIGLLAALWPARQASRLQILTAIATA